MSYLCYLCLFGSSLPPAVCRRVHVLNLRYMCLFAYSGVQHILSCVFVLFVLVFCTLCCQSLWIAHFRLFVRYYLTFI